MGDKKTREQAEAMFLMLFNIRANLKQIADQNERNSKERLNAMLGDQPKYVDSELVIEKTFAKELA